MTMLVTISIILGAVIYILWPLWRTGQTNSNMPLGNNGQLETLFDQRDNLLAILKDVESDYYMGKISTEDYQDLQSSYRTQAIQVLKQIDKSTGGVNASIEVAQESSGNGFVPEPADGKYCTRCEAAAGVEDRFCSYCGQEFT